MATRWEGVGQVSTPLKGVPKMFYPVSRGFGGGGKQFLTCNFLILLSIPSPVINDRPIIWGRLIPEQGHP